MNPLLVLSSGPVAVGKTAVADLLIRDHFFKTISSSRYLRSCLERHQIECTRTKLQLHGDVLDEQTQYAWLTDRVVRPTIDADPFQQRWLVDAVRKPEQIEYLRASYKRICHVHFNAKESVLRKRFNMRARVEDNSHSPVAYDQLRNSTSEQSVESCGLMADITIDVTSCSPAAATALLMERLIRDFDA